MIPHSFRMRLTSIVLALFLFAPVPGCGTNTYALRQKGDRALETRDYAGAIDAYGQVHEIAPEDYAANFGLGQALLAQGEPLRARTHLQVAYDQAWPRRDMAYEVGGFLATAMGESGDLDAMYSFLQDRAQSTGDERDYLRWGDMAHTFNDPDQAELAYRTAAKITGGESVEPYLRLVKFYEDIGDKEAAFARLRQAYGIRWDDPRVVELVEAYGSAEDEVTPLPADE